MIAATFAPLTFWQVATYVALLAAVVSLWIDVRVWRSCLAVAIALGYIAGVLQAIAIVWIAIAVTLCWWYARTANSHSRGKRTMTTIGVVAISLLLGLHALPGFNNSLVIDRVVLTADAEPFTMYLNFDKTLIGVLLLGVCYPQWQGIRGWFSSLRVRTVLLLVVNVVVLIAASYLLGYVHFDPKWAPMFWVWALTNLFSTCLSEEGFFRGFIQRELQLALLHVRAGEWLALGLAAVLFGCAHFAGGWRYVLLATLAGLGYGYIYRVTKRIEWAMLAHFALNTTHFLLFTYPRLA